MKKLTPILLAFMLFTAEISAQEIFQIKPAPVSMILYPEVFEVYSVESQDPKDSEILKTELSNIGLIKLNIEGLDFLVRIYDDATDYALHRVNLKPLLEDSISTFKVEKLGSFGWEYLPDPWKFALISKR